MSRGTTRPFLSPPQTDTALSITSYPCFVILVTSSVIFGPWPIFDLDMADQCFKLFRVLSTCNRRCYRALSEKYPHIIALPECSLAMHGLNPSRLIHRSLFERRPGKRRRKERKIDRYLGTHSEREHVCCRRQPGENGLLRYLWRHGHHLAVTGTWRLVITW